jgi:hypothetical protein
MDIKESIISSFFFHLILILLMVAASSYTTSFSGDPRNIVSVDLMMEEKDLQEAKADSAEEPPVAASPLPGEEISSPEQAISSPPEESKETSEPEKAEAVTEPAKIENAEEPPARTGGGPSMEAYYRFIMVHKRAFGQKARARVNQLLGEALKVNKREFYGGTAIVSLKFGPGGNLTEVLVDSASPELKAFFEEINWVDVPAPGYSLGFTGVRIEFTVLEGYMNFNVEAL